MKNSKSRERRFLKIFIASIFTPLIFFVTFSKESAVSINAFSSFKTFHLHSLEVARKLITIEIHSLGNDMVEMHYDRKEIIVPAKTWVKIVLINNSTDLSMIQNIVIVNPGDIDSVAMHGLEVGMSKNYVPNDKSVIAASGLVKPGKKRELVFKTPEKGEYRFISTYPGHYLNMQGRLIVE